MAHVVLRTNNFDQMRQFYKTFLGGTAAHENDFLSFITYDEEHHRIALIKFPDIKNKDYNTCGLEHVAFTFDSLKDLCTAYEQRKALGIEPGWCVVSQLLTTYANASLTNCQNRGPTTSMYYRDPDGNMIETQVDNFDDPEKATEMMASPQYAENAIGTDFDPEELCRQVESGVDDGSLKMRKDVGPRGAEAIEPIWEKIKSAPVGA